MGIAEGSGQREGCSHTGASAFARGAAMTAAPATWGASAASTISAVPASSAGPASSGGRRSAAATVCFVRRMMPTSKGTPAATAAIVYLVWRRCVAADASGAAVWLVEAP